MEIFLWALVISHLTTIGTFLYGSELVKSPHEIKSVIGGIIMSLCAIYFFVQIVYDLMFFALSHMG